MYVIVGGGRIGKELAEKIGEAIILEKDPSRAEILRNEGFNVLLCDAESEDSFSEIDLKNCKVILATNDDFTNITVAKIAIKKGAAEIIARVENQKFTKIYKDLGVICISCQRSIASDILTEVAESNRRYFEIKVSEKSHLSEKMLKDVFIGEDCVVISIFREGKLYRPHPDFKLLNGDLIGVLCGREVRKTKKPFDEILVVLNHPDIFESTLKEAKMLGEMFDSELFIMFKEKDVLVCKLRGDVTDVQEMEDTEILNVLKQFGHNFDLIVTGIADKSPFKNKKLMKRFDFDFSIPVLISKGRESFERVLAILNTDNPLQLLNCVRPFSHFSVIKLMILEEEAIDFKAHLLETFSSTEAELIKGNPVIEVVKEVKKDYDLVIFSIKNNVGNIDENILWRIVEKTPSSVLVVK